MSTFWDIMSYLKPVCSIKMWNWPKNHIFVPSPLYSLRLVCILKLESVLQGYVKWKNTMTGYVNFLTQNVRPWNCHKQFIWGYLPKNHIFVPSPLYFLRLVCILKLEAVLQGYVKWKNTISGYVNFLTQNVRPWNCHKQFIWGYWPKNHIFVPSPLYFLRLVCILKLEVVLQGYVKWKNTMTGYVNFLRQNVRPWNCHKQFIWGYWPKNHIFVPSPLYFLRLVCILKLEAVLKGYVKWKNTMTGYVNFLTQNVRPWNCHKQFIWGYWPKNHIFVPSPLYLLRLVCILKLEVVLQGYVKWKNTMTGYVNFLRQNVLSETSLLD